MSAEKANKKSQTTEEIEDAQGAKTESSPVQESPPVEAQLPPPSEKPVSPSEEHNWAMLAHLSILINLFTGFLGPAVAFIIYLVYKDRSRYIAYQSLQSTIFQLIVWVGVGLVIGAIWLITAILSVFLIGLLCVPFTLLATVFLLVVPLGSLVYGVYAAVQCSGGEDFRYWLVGDWVRGTFENV